MQIQNNTLALSDPTGTHQLQLDMTVIYQAESRFPEIKSVNSFTSTDLRVTFNNAAAVVARHMSVVRSTKLQISHKMSLIKARLLLDEYPDFCVELKKKGLRDNGDFREGFLLKDSDYANMSAFYDGLKAMEELLTAKKETLDRAYWDVRNNLEERLRLMGDRLTNSGSTHGNING